MQSIMSDNDIRGDFSFDELHNKDIEKKSLKRFKILINEWVVCLFKANC